MVASALCSERHRNSALNGRVVGKQEVILCFRLSRHPAGLRPTPWERCVPSVRADGGEDIARQRKKKLLQIGVVKNPVIHPSEGFAFFWWGKSLSEAGICR